jgi:hypothetical protein
VSILGAAPLQPSFAGQARQPHPPSRPARRTENESPRQVPFAVRGGPLKDRQ